MLLRFLVQPNDRNLHFCKIPNNTFCGSTTGFQLIITAVTYTKGREKREVFCISFYLIFEYLVRSSFPIRGCNLIKKYTWYQVIKQLEIPTSVFRTGNRIEIFIHFPSLGTRDTRRPTRVSSGGLTNQ